MSASLKGNVQKLALLALLTAIVIILQLLGAFVRVGPFSVSLVLMPIVIGAALTGYIGGAWLGLVFGIVVLFSPDAAIFLGINAVGTLIAIILKGTLAGFFTAVVYKAIEKKNKAIASVTAAIICPIVNTGVFIICLYIFFFDVVASAAGDNSILIHILTAMIGFNFIFELGINLVLCPIIIRLIQYGQKTVIKEV